MTCELSVVTESPQTYFWFLNTALKTSELWYYLAMIIHIRSYTDWGKRSYKLHDVFQCCLNCTEFGKLSLRKIIKFAATRCRILKLKCTKFDFGWGSAPDPAGELTALPRPPSWILGGLLLRGGEGKGRGKGMGRGGEREREGSEGKEGEGKGKGKGGTGEASRILVLCCWQPYA